MTMCNLTNCGGEYQKSGEDEPGLDWYRCSRCGHERLVRTPLPLPTPLVISPELSAVAKEVAEEVARATARWGAFNSAHEGFAVLAEEVDELWDEVKVNQTRRDLGKLRKEAIQCAAMAMRFVLDVCDGGRGRK